MVVRSPAVEDYRQMGPESRLSAAFFWQKWPILSAISVADTWRGRGPGAPGALSAPCCKAGKPWCCRAIPRFSRLPRWGTSGEHQGATDGVREPRVTAI